MSITAPTVINSGSITSTAGNVNLSGGGGNLAVTGTGGTIQAAHGNINLDASAGNSNINVSGGNWLSQNLNFNAGTGGSVNADVDQVSGVVNATACNAHITSATGNMQLGDMDVSGDPSYFNTAGNISIVGTVTGSPDLAIVASGNIIAGGGALDTSGTNGNINLIAGANFTAPGGTSTTTTASGADAGTLITITDSTTAGLGSKTGGFVDLSGSTLGGKGTPLTSIKSGSGNILMVAYKGSGANSGSIVGTGTVKSGGAPAITAGTGTVTMIGGGAQITAQTIGTSGGVTILGTAPSVGAGFLTIMNGALQAGAYVTTPATFTNTTINLTSITSTGNVSIGTAGKTSSTSKAPLPIINATGLTFNGTGTTSSLFVNSTGAATLTINPTNTSTLAGTLSVTAAGNIAVANDITGTKGIVDLTTAAGTITGTGVINGATATLQASGIIGTSIAAPLNIAVNTLTVNSSGGAVVV